MSLQEVKRVYQLTDSNGYVATPAIPDFIYSDCFATGWNKIEVAASATNVALPLTTNLGAIKILELRVVPNDIDKLSVRYNGSAKSYNISPIEITSETIGSITVTNSTTSVVDLYWRAISG